jgi:formyl-CoA transferase
MLADLGMDVLKVEEVDVVRGGRARDDFSPTVDDVDLESRAMAYNYVARNKRSIAINLKAQEGKDIFYKLAAKADVVLESFRRGVVKRLGVDYDTLKEINPRIVYASISGYGQEGKYADWPGQEGNARPMSGVSALTGCSDGSPAEFLYPGVNTFSSACTVISIQAALLSRESTGKGQFIDMALTESGMTLMGYATVNYFRRGYIPKRGQAMGVRSLKCKDGKYMASAAGAEGHFWDRFCETIGRPQYKGVFPAAMGLGGQGVRQDPEMDAMYNDLQELFLTRTRDEWMEIIPVDISVVPLLELDEVVEGDYAKDRGAFWEMKHPLEGELRQLGSPFRLQDTPPRFRNFAPLLGQDSESVLRDLGYSDAKIKRLEEDKAVRVQRWRPPQS